MTVETQLKECLVLAAQKAFDVEVSLDDVVLEVPKDNAHGDYASNLAMRLVKTIKQNPRQIAQGIIDQLDLEALGISHVDVAGPGFMNFTLKKGLLAQVITRIIEEGHHYGHNQVGQGQKILVEYISANPTGKIHIGHARGAAWGDSLCRLLKASGYEVLREYYVNDAGNQIDNLVESLYARIRELHGLDFELPQDGYHGQDVIEIARQLDQKDPDLLKKEKTEAKAWIRREGVHLELDRIKKDLADFRCGFDSWIYESDLYQSGKVKRVLDKLVDKGLTFEEDGALWFKSSQFGDDKDRVLIKKDGSYTYLVADIANHLDKLDRGYHHLVNLWGADHHGYVARVRASLAAFGYHDVLDVDFIQVVRLMDGDTEVKMSKRTGNAITLSEFCEEVGVDAVRYFMIARSLDTHLDFDIQLAKSQSNENAVFYAQYAHARIHSMLHRATDFVVPNEFDLLTSEKEVDLLKTLGQFPKVVSEAAQTRLPNKLCNYIQRLSQAYHSFYSVSPILNQPDKNLENQRLALSLATAITLRNALDLIGVSAPESM